jgi:hypothetical protein
MVSRLLLMVLQLVVGYYAAPNAMQALGINLGALQIFLFALVVAGIVWLVGILGALVLKDVARPSPSTLGIAIAAAVIFAALSLNDDVARTVSRLIDGRLDTQLYPLIGAVIGYAIKR